jgi:hypothetical protein
MDDRYRVLSYYQVMDGGLAQWHDEASGNRLGAYLSDVLNMLDAEEWEWAGSLVVRGVAQVVLRRTVLPVEDSAT